MGGLSSKKAPGQVLMVGPPESGKTTLLYKLVLQKKEWKADETIGFQYEEVRMGDEPNSPMVGVWDIGGGQATQLVLQQVYQLVRFESIVYMIRLDKTVQEGVGTPAISQIDYAKVHLNRLLAEIELEQVSNVHIFFNLSKKERRNKNIFDVKTDKTNTSDRDALVQFLCNSLDTDDMEATFSTVQFHYRIVDVIEDEKPAL